MWTRALLVATCVAVCLGKSYNADRHRRRLNTYQPHYNSHLADHYNHNDDIHFHLPDGSHAVNGAGIHDTVFRYDGALAIDIDTVPSELTVHSGQEVLIDCIVKGPQHFTITWSRVGGPLPRNAESGRGRLTIRDAKAADSGQYVCIVELNDNGRISTVERFARVHIEAHGGVAEQRTEERADPRHDARADPRSEPREEHRADPREDRREDAQPDARPDLAAGPMAAPAACRSDERTCQNGQCVLMQLVCDGARDCDDGSDEHGCSASQGGGGRDCEPNESQCANGKCVQKMWWCDGEDDCGDNSDEQQCKQRVAGETCAQTEYLCTRQQQCIPKAFHCDGQNDCQDGTDEIGCAPPTAVEPPPPRKQVGVGETFELRCRAVGTPTPVINWRKNWGAVCEPPRCTQSSDDGLGVLIIRGAQDVDAGAYTCEAINVNSRILVVPDCIVTVAGEAPPPPPAPVSTCNPDGSMSTRVGPDGQCECKRWVTGPNCDRCMSTAFFFARTNPHGCISCFCSGVTQQCTGSTWHRTSTKVDFGAGAANGVQITNQRITQTEQSPRFEFPERGFVQYTTSGGATQYFRLSDALGLQDDMVTAYGGFVTFRFKFSGGGAPISDPLFIIKGNLITLYYEGEPSYEAEREHTVRFKLMEHELDNEDRRQKTNREHVIMCLSDLDEVLVRATHVNGQRSSSLGSFEFEIAVNRDTQMQVASEVEECRCPDGYVGLSCEDCAPGWERSGGGLYLGTCEVASQQCHFAGAMGTAPVNGVCQCKQYVTGPNCDRCVESSFFLDPANPHGCIQCFCSGVTYECASANLYRQTQSLDFRSGSAQGVMVRTGGRYESDWVVPREQPRVVDGQLQQTGFGETNFASAPLYWQLNTEFLGDKLTSYGGTLRIKLKFDGYGTPSEKPLILLRGNDITLVYAHRQPLEAGREHTIDIRFYETEWQREDRLPTTRPHMLMTLSLLDALLIRAQHVEQCTSSSLISVDMEYAVDQDTGNARAHAVEQCRCPVGYKGLSCEECDVGYTRTGGGLYLGTCEPCQCNGHSTSCDAETGVCDNCVHNTMGEHCEQCVHGYTGDARRGTSRDCILLQTPSAPCQCNNHSPRGCDSNGRCILCEDFTEGFHCEACKMGWYGDATRGTNYDCTPCPCPGQSECFINSLGDVECKNCPPGFAGRLCDECAPGYVEDAQATAEFGQLKCKPIGQIGSTHIEYSNTRFHKNPRG